jgi:hypothetical protein
MHVLFVCVHNAGRSQMSQALEVLRGAVERALERCRPTIGGAPSIRPWRTPFVQSLHAAALKGRLVSVRRTALARSD